MQWWEGELERGYLLHRARYISDQSRLFSGASSAISALAAVCTQDLPSVPAVLKQRLNPPPIPSVQVVDPSGQQQQQQQKEVAGGGKRKAEEEEEKGQGPSEEERDAMIKYVVHELKDELYTVLAEGFHCSEAHFR